MSKIQLLYVVSTLQKCGPINQLYNIIINLDRSKYSVCVVTLSEEYENTRIDDYKKICDVILLGIHYKSFGYRAVRVLDNIVNRISPNVIHSQGFRADYLVSKIHYNVAKVSTLRGVLKEAAQMQYGLIKGAVMNRLHYNALKKFNICVGVSDSVYKYLQGIFSEKKVVCIYNGVDTDSFSIKEKNKHNIKNKWITVGHLSERKNVLSIIRAFKILSSDDRSLHILGDGPLKKECQGLISDSKNIVLHGKVNNVNKYLNESKYYITASRSEGLPNAVLEAMSSGLPVCMSSIGPHEEIYNKNTLIGEIFELDNINEMCDAIKDIERKSYEEMVVACRHLIYDIYSYKIMAKKYSELYQLLALNKNDSK